MEFTIRIEDSWLAHPEPLGRLLSHVKALESPCPWMPPTARQPGDDDDDLSALLEGMDDEPGPTPTAPPAALKAMPADPTPKTAQQLYRMACDRKMLPALSRLGKARGWPKLITQWEPDQVAAGYRELTAPTPATNGRPR